MDNGCNFLSFWQCYIWRGKDHNALGTLGKYPNWTFF